MPSKNIDDVRSKFAIAALADEDGNWFACCKERYSWKEPLVPGCINDAAILFQAVCLILRINDPESVCRREELNEEKPNIRQNGMVQEKLEFTLHLLILPLLVSLGLMLLNLTTFSFIIGSDYTKAQSSDISNNFTLMIPLLIHKKLDKVKISAIDKRFHKT